MVEYSTYHGPGFPKYSYHNHGDLSYEEYLKYNDDFYKGVFPGLTDDVNANSINP